MHRAGAIDLLIHSVFARPPGENFWEGLAKTKWQLTHIHDLFYLSEGDIVKVHRIGRQKWSRQIENDVGQQQCDRRRTTSTPLVNLAHVKAALIAIREVVGPIDNSNKNERLASYKWQRTASDSARAQRTTFARQPVHLQAFKRTKLREKFRGTHTEGMRQARLVTVYSDGSLITTPEQLSLSFAAVFSYHDQSGARQEFVAAGRTIEGPFSSTTAELMALALAVAIAPREVPMRIYSDSRAAIKIAKKLQDHEDVRRDYEKSNIAYLAAWVRPWFQERTAATVYEWVKGH
ncbi:hypothetical protein GGI20_000995, partial [Coemansia sp. BCRC 34301]